MAITNSDILTYITTNRLHVEDSDYALQEKTLTMGDDSVGSARAWMYGRFLMAGQLDSFAAFVTATWTDLDDTDLTELSTIRAAYYTNTSDTNLAETYTLLFDTLVLVAISKIWDAAGMDGESAKVMRDAQELVSAIVGALANPDNVIGGDEGGTIAEGLPPIVSVDPYTDDDYADELGGYR